MFGLEFDGKTVAVAGEMEYSAGEMAGPVRFIALPPGSRWESWPHGEPLPEGWHVWTRSEGYWPRSRALSVQQGRSWWLARTTTGAACPDGLHLHVSTDDERLLDPEATSERDAIRRFLVRVYGPNDSAVILWDEGEV